MGAMNATDIHQEKTMIATKLSYYEPAHRTSGRILVLDEDAEWTSHAGPNDIVVSHSADGWWVTFVGEDGESSGWDDPAGNTAEEAIEAIKASGIEILPA